MLKIILKLEKGKVPDRKPSRWKIEGEKRRVTRNKCKRLRVWNIAKKKLLEDRGTLPQRGR